MSKRDALNVKDKMMLLGFEGLASNVYFEVLPWLILNQKDSFPFNGRNRRPPKDASMRCCPWLTRRMDRDTKFVYLPQLLIINLL